MKNRLIIAAVLAFLLSLLPSAIRTWTLASDAHGLVVLATLAPEQTTHNPYSQNGYLVNQSIAVWLLKTFDYPYDSCSEMSEAMENCEISLVSWVGRTLDSNDAGVTERGYDLLDHFIARGEDVNQLNEGLAPVHEAILYRNARYLKTLLAAGADMNMKIVQPGKAQDGLDAWRFLELLESKQQADFSAVREIIGHTD
jgi:hypothetical protein